MLSKTFTTLCHLDWLGSYLAGLIEGDGSIYVPDQQSNKKKYPNARIKIVFNIKDEPLAKKLHALLESKKEPIGLKKETLVLRTGGSSTSPPLRFSNLGLSTSSHISYLNHKERRKAIRNEVSQTITY
jgi:hypothetical protein